MLVIEFQHPIGDDTRSSGSEVPQAIRSMAALASKALMAQ